MREGKDTGAVAHVATAAIIAILSGVLAERFTGVRAFEWVALVGMAVALGVSARRFGFREWYLAALSAALTVALALGDDAPGAAIMRGLDQAAFLMAFIYLLTMLTK